MRLPDPGGERRSIPRLFFRPFESSKDILYRLSSDDTTTDELLAGEFDIHIPRQLADQTKAHWVASALDQYVLIQPIEEQGSLHSPLFAIEMLVRTLKANEGLLVCDGGTLLLCTVDREKLVLEALPFSFELLLQEGNNHPEWLAYFPVGIKIFLIGSDVDTNAREALSLIQPYVFQLLPIQNILALVDVDASARGEIEANTAFYALSLGLAAHLAKGKLRPLLIR